MISMKQGWRFGMNSAIAFPRISRSAAVTCACFPSRSFRHHADFTRATKRRSDEFGVFLPAVGATKPDHRAARIAYASSRSDSAMG
jgi:hypothetical protein